MNIEQQITKIKGIIHNISDEGQQISTILERGQAETPLNDLFQRLEEGLVTEPFSLVLLGLTTEARTDALSWLYGKDFALLTVNIPKLPGLFEIELRERGYVLETSSGEHTEFDKIDQLIQAVSQSSVGEDDENLIHPVRLGIESQHKLQGLKVLMPENPSLVLSNPSLLNRLISESNLVVVAAPLKYSPTENDWQVLSEIRPQMDAFWPFITVNELEDDIQQIETGWWEQISSNIRTLPPLLLTTHLLAKVPDLLSNKQAAIRTALFLTHQAHRFESAIDTLKERQKQDLNQLEIRKKREQRKMMSGAEPGKSSKHYEWERLRQSINDHFSTLNKNLRERSRRSLLSTSILMEEVDQFLNTLTINDLVQKDSYKNILLNVHDDFIFSLQRQLSSLLKTQFREDLTEIKNGIKEIENNITNTTQQLSTLPLNYHNKLPEEKEIWAQLREVLTVDVKYQGEIPKRGIFQRLGEGRRAVYTILMTSGIIATFAGINIRNSRIAGLFGIIFFFIFIGVFIYTFFSWKKEDEIKLEKEVERLRNGVSAEIKRLLNDIQRIKLDKLNDIIEENKKTIFQSLDDISRKIQSQMTEEVTKQKQLAEQRLQLIERSRQELLGLNRNIQNLERESKQLQRACSELIDNSIG